MTNVDGVGSYLANSIAWNGNSRLDYDEILSFTTAGLPAVYGRHHRVLTRPGTRCGQADRTAPHSCRFGPEPEGSSSILGKPDSAQGWGNFVIARQSENMLG